MSENLYAPSAVPIVEPSDAIRTEFYVVGITKYVLLAVATLGLYQVFWFYMHWARYRSFHRASMMPAARAIFALFFAHSLNRRIDQRLRENGVDHAWRPALAATGYVVLTLATLPVSVLAMYGSGWIEVLSYLIFAGVTWSLAQVQRAANAACGEPDGGSNRRLTWANWIWLAMGGLFWLLTLIGLLLQPIEVTLPDR